MSHVLPIVVMAVLIAGWWGWLYRRSGGRIWNPLWVAFTATALSMIYLIAGLTGHTLVRNSRGTHSDDVIWWEVGVSVLLAVAAARFWRRGVEWAKRQ